MPPELQYNIQYIKVLALAGKDNNAAIQTKAGEILPIDDVICNMEQA